MTKNNYGAQFSMALTNCDGDIEVGANLQNSEGLNVSSEVKTDNFLDAIDTIYQEMLEGIYKFQKEQDCFEDKLEQLEEIDPELFALQVDNKLLEDKVKELEDKVKELDIENKKLRLFLYN